MMRALWRYVSGLRGAAALFAIAVLLLIAPRAEASAIPLTLPSNVAASGTSYVTKASAAFSGAAFNSGLTTQVSGKLVTVPAVWRLASNAGQVATSALRLTPTTFIGSAVLAWLLPYGLEWLDGKWQKKTGSAFPGDAPGTGYYYNGSPSLMDSTPEGACGKVANVWWQGAPEYWADWNMTYYIDTSARCFMKLQAKNNPSLVQYPYNGIGVTKVPNAYPVQYQDAVETDWAYPAADPVPDAVINWLVNKGLAAPIVPEVNPATQTVPLSDPYVDPVTGKRYKDVAYVTPSPSSPTKTADLQVAKQEVDAEGNPIVDPTTGGVKAPEETDDPCLAHPDRIGCMDKGEIPAAPDLELSEKTITITPDAGWGPDTAACPADIVNNLRSGGAVVAYSFKAQCDFADGVRAPVIAIAWVAAVLIALGVGSRGGG